MPYRLCPICSEYAHCRYCAHCYKDGPWYCSVECQRLHWVQEHRAVCGSVARQSIFDMLLIQSVPHATNEIGRTIAEFDATLHAPRHWMRRRDVAEMLQELEERWRLSRDALCVQFALAFTSNPCVCVCVKQQQATLAFAFIIFSSPASIIRNTSASKHVEGKWVRLLDNCGGIAVAQCAWPPTTIDVAFVTAMTI